MYAKTLFDLAQCLVLSVQVGVYEGIPPLAAEVVKLRFDVAHKDEVLYIFPDLEKDFPRFSEELSFNLAEKNEISFMQPVYALVHATSRLHDAPVQLLRAGRVEVEVPLFHFVHSAFRVSLLEHHTSATRILK
jgi:hypothetical protein